VKPIAGIIPLLLFCCMVDSDYALSQEVAVEIQPLTQNGIPYVSGGTGQDEKQAMTSIRKDYDFHATFALKKTGEYLADVGVTIQNPSGDKVFDGNSLGPLFFAKLPPGKYKITAVSDGKSQTQSILLNKSGTKDLYFYWESE